MMNDVRCELEEMVTSTFWNSQSQGKEKENKTKPSAFKKIELFFSIKR